MIRTSEKRFNALSCRLAKLCLRWQSYYLTQGATEPNNAERKVALFWTLLPQLFAQFETQSDNELFELLNPQSEATEQKVTPQMGHDAQPLRCATLFVVFTVLTVIRVQQKLNRIPTMGGSFPPAAYAAPPKGGSFYVLRAARKRPFAPFATRDIAPTDINTRPNQTTQNGKSRCPGRSCHSNSRNSKRRPTTNRASC